MTHAHITIFYSLPKRPPQQKRKGLSSSPEHPILPLRIFWDPSSWSLSQKVRFTL